MTQTVPNPFENQAPVVAETLEQLKAKADIAKAAAKEQKAAQSVLAKAAAAELKAAEKAAKEQAKLDEKAAKEQGKLQKIEADKLALAAAADAKEASKTPSQNGIRRPKDGTACGAVWASADTASQLIGTPVAIAELLKLLPAMSPSTVKTQYALWRKFHGVTGRVSAPVVVPEVPSPAPAPAAKASADFELPAPNDAIEVSTAQAA